MTRDNVMLRKPNDPFKVKQPSAVAAAAAQPGSGMLLKFRDEEIGFIKGIALSLFLHLGVIAAIALVLFALKFFGINLLTFDRPAPIKDMEFQLVESPEQTPINRNTKIRAKHNTRAGGQAKPNARKAENLTAAGQSKPQPKPAPQITKTQQQSPVPAPQQPQRRPSPPQPQAKPVAQKPTQNQEKSPPAPPRPRVSAPRPAPSRTRYSTVPNPLSPIHAPEAPSPVGNTGPLVKGPSASSNGSSGNSTAMAGGATPATLPGQFSGGGRPSSGGAPSGQGGRSSYSQYGNPGGGNGRPGVDALAEPNFDPYMAELQRRIRRNWHPPEDQENKTVVYLFTITKDGRLQNPQVKRSSGSAEADAAALQAIRFAAPFRPLPAEFRGNQISIEFRFDYNVFQGGNGIYRR